MDWTLIINSTFSAVFSLEAAVFVLAAMGLNVHYGYTGLLNFGQVGFMAAGAYGIVLGSSQFGWGLWGGIAFGLGLSVVFALLLGLPTLRLRGDYLAIVTIAFGEIVRLVVSSEKLEDATGGGTGTTIQADPFYRHNPFGGGEFYQFGPFKYQGTRLWTMIFAWALVVSFALITWLLMRSPWGRVLKSIREDEVAARALGKNVYAYKMQSLVLGGVMGAVAGIVQSVGYQAVTPDRFTRNYTFLAYTALILGGAARVKGPIIGGMIFWTLFVFVDQLVNGLVRADLLPDWLMNSDQAGLVSFMALGISLMVLPVYRPQGIFGSRRELEMEVR